MEATIFKIQLFLNSGRWGWNETYYWVGQADAAKWTPVTGDVDVALVKGRMGMVGNNVALDAVRLTRIDGARKRQTALYSGAAYTFTRPAIPAAEPWQSALCFWSVDFFLYTRVQELRGLPDTWYQFSTTDPRNPVFPADMLTAYAAFRDVIDGVAVGSVGNFVIRALDTDAGVNDPFPVTQVDLDDTIVYKGFYRIHGATLPDSLTWPQGTKIRVSGAKGTGTNGLNGPAVVLLNLPDGALGREITISRRPKCPGGNVILEGEAQARGSDVVYQPITGGGLRGYNKRNTGRAFFVTAGRQGGKRC